MCPSQFYMTTQSSALRNPFIVGFCAPAYQLIAATTITNDFLLTAMFIMATLAILGAYVTDFPLLSTLYMNEVAHKTALSSLLGMLLGLILFLVFTSFSGEANDSEISAQGQLMVIWGVLSLPSYPLMVFLMSKVNKRDLDAEQKVRDEKKKNRRDKGGGPPIMDRPGF